MGVDNFIDTELPLWLNIFIIIGNIINLIYNIPQIYLTFKRKSTRDISGIFMVLRLVGNLLILVYTLYIADVQLSIAYVVTILASAFLCFYKIHDILEDNKIKKRVKDTEGRSRNVTSIDVLISQLQDYTRENNCENVVIEDMIIDKKMYKVLYLKTYANNDNDNYNHNMENRLEYGADETEMTDLETDRLTTKN